MSSPENTRPQYTGTSYVSHSVASIVFGFTLNNASFSIVAASPDDEGGDALVPADYNFDDSIEGKILDEIIDLSVHDGDGVWSTAKQQATRRLKKQLADLAVDACLPTMRRLAPTEIPPAQTLQDTLYPPTYTLQVFTEDGKLACRTLDDFTGDSGAPSTCFQGEATGNEARPRYYRSSCCQAIACHLGSPSTPFGLEGDGGWRRNNLQGLA
jgi:hypothetical protein